MRETSFIEQNKKKWNRFEELYESTANDPEELSNLYLEITDDLSYAQTFYKRRTVRAYLNQLAQRVFTGVHKQKGESLKNFFSVWHTSLPLEIYRSRKNLLFALIAFIVYALIGVVTSHVDPDFARVVLGDGYIQMTMENIQQGNPLGVYETNDQMAMFIQITTNNLKVAFLTFFVGLFFTLGTHMLLFYNGVMVGTFQYFFHAKGLLVTSFLGIWIHGAFEISAIVLAGGAGITAGNGLLFPQSYTRLQSMQLSVKRGLKIMLSLVPFIIAAGFLESYVTANYQDLPNWSKWVFILFSFAVILFFYVFYPAYVARKHPELINREEASSFRQRKDVDFFKIRSVGEISSDAFRLYRLKFAKFSRVLVQLVLPMTLLVVTFQNYNHYFELQKEFWFDWAGQLTIMMGLDLSSGMDALSMFLWSGIIALIYTAVFWSIQEHEKRFSWTSFFQYVKKRFVGIWLGNSFLLILVFFLPWYFLLISLFVFPFIFLIPASMALDEGSVGARLKKGFSYSRQHYGKSLLALLILLILTTLLMQPIAFIFSIHEGWNNEPMVRDVLDMVADFTKRVARVFTDDYLIWSNVVRQVVYLMYVFALLPLLVIVMALGFLSEREKNEANGLRKAFEKFGRRSRTKETQEDFE